MKSTKVRDVQLRRFSCLNAISLFTTRPLLMANLSCGFFWAKLQQMVHGADPMARDRDSVTALMLCASNDAHEGLARALIAHSQAHHEQGLLLVTAKSKKDQVRCNHHLCFHQPFLTRLLYSCITFCRSSLSTCVSPLLLSLIPQGHCFASCGASWRHGHGQTAARQRGQPQRQGRARCYTLDRSRCSRPPPCSGGPRGCGGNGQRAGLRRQHFTSESAAAWRLPSGPC